MFIKIKKILVGLVLLSLFFLSSAVPVLAAEPCGDTCSSGAGGDAGGSTMVTTNDQTFCDSKNLTTKQQQSCAQCESTNGAVQDCLQGNPIIQDLQLIVNFLSALVGIVVIGAIILGGIQYSMAGTPDAVAKAKGRITNGVMAFAVFLFIFAFLQWLIPGGIFK